MKALRIKLHQTSANYRKEETVENKMTYPLPPISTVIGALHNACGYTEYHDMDVSIQGRFVSMHKEPYIDYCFLNSTMDDRGILVKMKNGSMLSTAYEKVASAVKSQGNSFLKGITIQVHDEALLEEYRNLRELGNRIAEWKKTEYKQKLSEFKEKKEALAQKKRQTSKDAPDFEEIRQQEQAVREEEKHYKAEVASYEEEHYKKPLSNYRTLVKSLKYYEILDDIELILHISASDDVLNDIYENIYNLKALGRSEDFVDVEEVKLVDLVQKNGIVYSRYSAYLNYHDVVRDSEKKKKNIFIGGLNMRQYAGTQYYMGKKYVIEKDKRLFPDKIKVIYTSNYGINKTSERVWLDCWEKDEEAYYIVNFLGNPQKENDDEGLSFSEVSNREGTVLQEIPEIQENFAKQSKTIKEHAEDLLEQAKRLQIMGYVENDHIYNLLQEACIHHDDGKANPLFQARIKYGGRFDPTKEIAHNILSVYYLNREKYAFIEDYRIIACAILYHHDYCNEQHVINEQKDLIHKLLKKGYAHEIDPEDLMEITGNMLQNPEAIMVKGLLHRCDYSASGNYQVEYPNDFLLPSLERMMESWQRKNPASHWNELQRFCMENREKNVIAIASTGMGKTEAGLQWIGNQKGFFILPIRTAINAIYDRVKDDILQGENLTERLALLHSESLAHYESHSEEADLLEYYDRGKTLSLPLNISTMDQLFDFVFKYKGYEMKLVTLSYSKLVIDEIQMYGPDLLAYLICGVRQIHQLGGKIAVVTATLPPFIRDMLLKDAEIPFEEAHFMTDVTRHSVCVKDCSLSPEDIMECYRDNAAAGRSNKILVVCNTIRKAQALYDNLRVQDEDLDLHIFHSRFTKAERKKLEGEILKFGRTYREPEGELDAQNGIWIATSLVEVSLDIDFDYLFTELSELNALFQRMGRCNRKGVKRIDGYNCFIYCDGSDVRRGNKGFIDAVFYQCSRDALRKADGLLSEKEKMNMINKFFTTERVRESDFIREYRRIFTQFQKLNAGDMDIKDRKKLRTIATCDIIPKPVYDQKRALIDIKTDRLRKIVKNRIPAASREGDMEEVNRLYRKRIELQEDLKGFVVSIPAYEFDKNKDITYGDVEISKYMKVPIVDCHYDEKGYYPLSREEKDEEERMIF